MKIESAYPAAINRPNEITLSVYEHCLTSGAMGEYRDWELPNIMERRAALRTSAIVKSLLKVNCMTRSITLRLAKLEGANSREGILVWCDDEDQVEATIADMIERKEIKASDRICCVYWLRARRSAGDHERWLESLEEST